MAFDTRYLDSGNRGNILAIVSLPEAKESRRESSVRSFESRSLAPGLREDWR
jgi:hypothetical protein